MATVPKATLSRSAVNGRHKDLYAQYNLKLRQQMEILLIKIKQEDDSYQKKIAIKNKSKKQTERVQAKLVSDKQREGSSKAVDQRPKKQKTNSSNAGNAVLDVVGGNDDVLHDGLVVEEDETEHEGGRTRWSMRMGRYAVIGKNLLVL